MNEMGKRAITTYNYSPFIDASCRREPDFENPFPSITALCRQGIFAPHLKENEVVVYITVAGKYAPFDERHHRLVAILQVAKVYRSHQSGQTGYLQLNAPLPSNCMVPNNPPYNYDQTAGKYQTKTEIKRFLSKSQEQQSVIGQRALMSWDEEYLQKSLEWPSFVRTKPLYVNTINPAPIFRSHFKSIFGGVPNTRSPKSISKRQLVRLARLGGVKIVFK